MDTTTERFDPALLDLVEVYRSADDFDARTAIDEVLAAEGIDAQLRDRRSHALPAPDSQPGVLCIAVAADVADLARATLREAQEAGILDPARGEVIR